ncbi:MAG: hypothetical protein GFH27_549285n224 [Chloroflexi bacterium AL-W]|nr:hypothetical protein [Chloroflexi bacterium AL-N1]NOK65736.1 hypothetical protein [Chloroflexi bacterium AL-N10]NOK74323.1 hypothetical protein [Chloroflexi bacterium AL-N5]NOK80769.1 hypothetical protein [Chloroflexi bacterium AL-W]NOK88581.1 hypothetical protein [Chloroflexi bacterium AL-N15]
MSKASLLPRSIRSLLFLIISLLLVSLLSSSVQAALIQSPLDNTVPDFARGAFQRSSLSLLQKSVPSAKLEDQEGAVQLGPIGLLEEWRDSSFRLPKRLAQMGAATIGNRIYLVGGVTPLDQASSTDVDEVWSVGVSLDNGTLLTEWEAEPALPAAQASYVTGFNAPIGPVNSPAVTAVDNASGNDYIYAIGGNVSFGTFDVSSYSVRIATVGANGRISGWQEGPPIPSPVDGCVGPETGRTECFSQLGMQDATAVSMSVGGVNYVYLIGGLQRYYQGSGLQRRSVDEGSNKVFYARVGANGNLFKPSNPSTVGWDLLDGENVSVPTPNDVGIWDGATIIDRFVVSGIGLYYMGGQTGNIVDGDTPAVRSSTVYRAAVQGDGRLSWSGETYTLPEARIGHASVTANGNIYVTGGQPSNSDEPDRSVLTSYVEDDLALPSFGDANFLGNDALPAPRTEHASVFVKATTDNLEVPETGFVYVLGGQGDTGDGIPEDDQGSDGVIYSRVNGDEDLENSGYAPTGWFYSEPFDINFQQAEIQEINWATEIDRAANMDIRLDYRVSSANTCDNPGWSDADWQVLDGSPGDALNSVDGQNTVGDLTADARCFQYRARLTTGSTEATPSLLNVSIKIFIPGSPDLKVIRLEGLTNSRNQFTGMDITIQNEYAGPADEPTLAADAEGPGQFFVDMFIFGPGETPQTPQLPIDRFPSGPSSKAYTRVNKSLMGVGASLSLTNYTWCLSSGEPTSCTPAPLIELFPIAGTYTVIVGVDSFGCTEVGCVNESAEGAEANNVSQVQVTLPPQDPNCTENCPPAIGNPDLYLPIVGR